MTRGQYFTCWAMELVSNWALLKMYCRWTLVSHFWGLSSWWQAWFRDSPHKDNLCERLVFALCCTRRHLCSYFKIGGQYSSFEHCDFENPPSKHEWLRDISRSWSLKLVPVLLALVIVSCAYFSRSALFETSQTTELRTMGKPSTNSTSNFAPIASTGESNLFYRPSLPSPACHSPRLPCKHSLTYSLTHSHT